MLIKIGRPTIRRLFNHIHQYKLKEIADCIWVSKLKYGQQLFLKSTNRQWTTNFPNIEIAAKNTEQTPMRFNRKTSFWFYFWSLLVLFFNFSRYFKIKINLFLLHLIEKYFVSQIQLQSLTLALSFIPIILLIILLLLQTFDINGPIVGTSGPANANLGKTIH